MEPPIPPPPDPDNVQVDFNRFVIQHLEKMIRKDSRLKGMEIHSKGPGVVKFINIILGDAHSADDLSITLKSYVDPPIIDVFLSTDLKKRNGIPLMPNGLIEFRMNAKIDLTGRLINRPYPEAELDQIKDDIKKWIGMWLEELPYSGYEDSEGHITRQESKLPRFKDYFINEIDKLGMIGGQSSASAPMMAEITPPSDGVKKLYKLMRARKRRKKKARSK